MKLNRHIVAVALATIVAVIGWGLYWQQRTLSQELMSKAPTPAPAVTGRIFGNFQKYENGLLTIGIRAEDDDTALLPRTLPVSLSVTVVQYDPQTNDYSGQSIESFAVGVWLIIDTDDSGTVIAITAGR